MLDGNKIIGGFGYRLVMGERGKLSDVLVGDWVGLGGIGGWRYRSLILASQVVDFDHEMVFFFHVADCSEHF